MTDPSTSNAGAGYGQLDPTDAGSPFNQQLFIIWQQLAKISTLKVVQVKAVDTSAKTVDVQPMVNMLDGNSQSSPHGTILGIPYWQWQFGKNAIIADPVVDDIGVMICADRDISAVKATKKIANPGSDRQLDAADGIYFGGILNGEAEQSIKFTDSGVEIHDKNSNSLISSSTGWAFTGIVTFNENVQFAGQILGGTGAELTQDLKTTGDVVAGTVSLKNHLQSGVATGGANSGPPVP